MMITGADLIAGPGQIVSEFTDHIFPDLILLMACPGKENDGGYRFRALHSFRMVMRHFRGPPCHLPGSLQTVIQPSRRGDTHRRAISIAAIGLCSVREEPGIEHPAITRIGSPASPFLHQADQLSLHFVLDRIRSHIHEGFRYRDRHDRIVRVLTLLCEKLKLLRLPSTIKFKSAANDISQNSSVHSPPP